MLQLLLHRSIKGLCLPRKHKSTFKLNILREFPASRRREQPKHPGWSSRCTAALSAVFHGVAQAGANFAPAHRMAATSAGARR
jgi:hypothetical protein